MVDINKKISVEEAKKIYQENNHRIVDENQDSFVSLKNINKIYPNNVQAVYDFNLDIKKNDFIALVGPSGCGKSTTLRMIAGLEEISSGHLYIDGVLSNYLESKDRDIAMVFQSYALYPHLNVFDNIGFGLKIRKLDKKEIEERVFKAAEILNLGEYLDRKPKELSGGQMQRVALGRAIVRNSKIFLMDEPLSNLDAKLRVQMRSEIVRIHEEVDATTIYVTHDQTEAMTMANKIVVMNEGFVQQIGAPMEIYENPKNLFVATFIGTSTMNIIDAKFDKSSIKFDNDFSIKLQQKVCSKYMEFINCKINEIESLIEENNPEKNKLYVLYIPQYREKFIVKNKVIISKGLFKKKKKIIANEIRNEEYLEALKEMKNKYIFNKENIHNIKIGIRPEAIRIEEKESDDTLKVYTDIVEILGNEFIAYGKSKIGQLTIKSVNRIKSKCDINVKLDENKIYIFDEISQENIML